jgi:hypothetical protein
MPFDQDPIDLNPLRINQRPVNLPVYGVSHNTLAIKSLQHEKSASFPPSFQASRIIWAAQVHSRASSRKNSRKLLSKMSFRELHHSLIAIGENQKTVRFSPSQSNKGLNPPLCR